MPYEKWISKLQEYGTFRIKVIDGKEVRKSIHRGKLINNDDIAILSCFNSEIRGLYNFYRLADNVSTLNSFYWYMTQSLYKTFASKYKTTVNKIKERYEINKVFTVKYHTKKGLSTREFYHDGFKKQTTALTGNIDCLPRYHYYNSTNSLAKRLKSGKCELCMADTDIVYMHHVRALKDLTDKTEWERIMLHMRRKSIALCANCYRAIHECKL